MNKSRMKKDFAKPGPERRQLIISHLQEKKAVTQREVAGWCDCNARTVRRDVERLCNEGWPIESGSFGYRLRNASAAEKQN